MICNLAPHHGGFLPVMTVATLQTLINMGKVPTFNFTMLPYWTEADTGRDDDGLSVSFPDCLKVKYRSFVCLFILLSCFDVCVRTPLLCSMTSCCSWATISPSRGYLTRVRATRYTSGKMYAYFIVSSCIIRRGKRPLMTFRTSTSPPQAVILILSLR